MPQRLMLLLLLRKLRERMVSRSEPFRGSSLIRRVEFRWGKSISSYREKRLGHLVATW